jgi:hypothetical protein
VAATRDNNRDIGRYGPGCIILSAFSIELYLKCLLAIECGQYPETHNLQMLFGQLRPQTRDALRKRHDANLQRPGNLDEMLAKGGEAFNKVRYLFEHRDQIQFGLNWLGELVRQKVISLHPEWEADDATFPVQ